MLIGVSTMSTVHSRSYHLPVAFYVSSLLFCILRFRYRLKKYVLWGLIGGAYCVYGD
jgi:hypothetical protein